MKKNTISTSLKYRDKQNNLCLSVHDFQTVFSYYPRFLDCANNGIVED